jgi:lysophospholipase L1-like esterase
MINKMIFKVGMLILTAVSARAESGLRNGDHVAVIGDSITEQRKYSVFMEDYMLMCMPKVGLSETQFGWGGEVAAGCAKKMAQDCVPFKPTVATTMFGHNDGGSSPMDPSKAKWYHDGEQSIVKQLKEAGTRFIVIGSPIPVDSYVWHKDKPEMPVMFNGTLSAMRDIDRKLAAEEGVAFADLFTPMMDVMVKAKAKYGKEYSLAGGDGVHPDNNGHLVMAYAFLKALGCDGNIGTITVNLGANTAIATEGHHIQSVKNGVVEVVSRRYPFCFYGDPASTNSTRGMLEFIPFNQDLNRFLLVVKNAKAQKMKVTWGKESREYSATELAKGINLAAEFLDNPFSEPFSQVEKAIYEKQTMEVDLVKSGMYNLPTYRELLPEDKTMFDKVQEALMKKDAAARATCAAAVKPVTHTIIIEPVR